MSLSELERLAKLLSAEDRARLAEVLLESLQSPQLSDIQSAWDKEIEARIAAFERGDVESFAAEARPPTSIAVGPRRGIVYRPPFWITAAVSGGMLAGVLSVTGWLLRDRPIEFKRQDAPALHEVAAAQLGERMAADERALLAVTRGLTELELTFRRFETALATGERSFYRPEDDDEIRRMNHQFLGLDEPTDVLSFPDEVDDFVQGLSEEKLLGDIAISLPTAVRQAEAAGHGLDSELAHLLTHGILHLCGYDHVTSEEDEARMRAREEHYLGDLKFVHRH